jgi:type VI secretion system protein ImpH
MARENRRPASDLKSSLLRDGRRYSFVQTLRLLRGLIRRETGESSEDRVLRHQIKVRPELSLVFPETDIDSIQESPEEPFISSSRHLPGTVRSFFPAADLLHRGPAPGTAG